MLTKDLVESLRQRYDVHPLVFNRCVGRAKNDAELFDMLDSFPKKFPIVWSEEEYRWITTNDPYLFQDFDL
jgi:hypothetical protein